MHWQDPSLEAENESFCETIEAAEPEPSQLDGESAQMGRQCRSAADGWPVIGWIERPVGPAELRAGVNVGLLCVCRDARDCHRSLIAAQIVRREPSITSVAD